MATFLCPAIYTMSRRGCRPQPRSLAYAAILDTISGVDGNRAQA